MADARSAVDGANNGEVGGADHGEVDGADHGEVGGAAHDLFTPTARSTTRWRRPCRGARERMAAATVGW